MSNSSLAAKPHRLARRRKMLRKWFTAGLLWSFIMSGLSPILTAQTGNISPDSIEIDNFANHQDNNGVNIKNTGATIDWIKDTAANGDPGNGTPALSGSVANWIQEGLTGRVGGTGHWYGTRIVDSAATLAGNKDPDAFLSGGKVNDPDSWNIGAGVVGGPKFDASQAYLAANDDNIYFGMERMGNNGTTAFEFEFNQKPPKSMPGSPNDGYVPDRSTGDIIFAFELRGSGGESGSVATFVLRYDAATPGYSILCDDIADGAPACDSLPAPYDNLGAPLSSINAEGALAPPWGRRSSQGAWVSTAFERRLFAESQVPQGFLPDLDSCGGSFFVQLRTRASVTLNSDAKDTTKYFEFVFGDVSADGMLTNACGTSIHYDGSGSTAPNGSTLTYSWQFQKYDPENENADENGWVDFGSPQSGETGDYDPGEAGRFRAILTVSVDGSSCEGITETEYVDVTTAVGGSASLAAACDEMLLYHAEGTGGSGSYLFEWTIYKEKGLVDDVATTFETGPGATSDGSLDVDNFNSGANGDGEYYAVVKIKDANETSCFVNRNGDARTVRHALTASASKTSAASPATGINFASDSGFVATLTGSTNALAGDSVTTEWQYSSDGDNFTNSGDTDLTYQVSLVDIFLNGAQTSAGASVQILGDTYKVNIATLYIRVRAIRIVNGNSCPANSPNVPVKAVKGIDP